MLYSCSKQFPIEHSEIIGTLLARSKNKGIVLRLGVVTGCRDSRNSFLNRGNV